MKADRTKTKKGLAQAPPRDSSLGANVKSEIVAWFWVIFAFLLINGTLAQARVIPSGSMENTLLVGDHLIMSRAGYDAGVPFTNWHVPLWRNPHRQQIVIFKPPYAPNQTDLIKRVIGMPGDTIDVRAGAVWINGNKLEEGYTTGPTALPEASELLPSAEKLPFTIPAHQYFVMGDNRGNSYDSRFWGCVPRSAILGTPVTIYLSVDEPGQAWSGSISARLLAYGDAVVHPGKIRWKRLFDTFK